MAYELAAEWAEQYGEAAARAGGARGPFLGQLPEIGKGWDDLRTLERHDVLQALGSQARSAVFEFRRAHAVDRGEAVIIKVDEYTMRMCEQAREALAALTDPSGTKPWTTPRCDHCAGLLATALILVQVTVIEASGIGDPATVLRMLAAGSMTLPAQREASDAISQ
jgi:hypothetical protein